MELRHLRHFVALAEEGSFTRAAARELIVQSGLSSSVRALEKDVGAPLFVRGTRPVRLTAEGQALVGAARRALDAAAASYQAVRDVRTVLTGHLRIGAMQTSAHVLPFSSWLAGFSRLHPGVDITVRHLPARRMLAMVHEGELDCAMVAATPDGGGDLTVLTLASDVLIPACGPDHRLAGADSVTLGELAGERFVETHSEWGTRTMVDAVFAQAGLARSIVCEVGDWALLADLVAQGVGVAFLPRRLNADLLPASARSLRLVPLRDARVEHRIDLVAPEGYASHPAARRFMAHVRRQLRTQSGDTHLD
ncbi:LysR family transcriptional regulator [Streptomyces sp. NRRL F-5126]|uniref:LysR family transcriptional regulator n=1 Tax=Streptomyces sp. NRRL F-5126 TaxID=1463857 RepID=UPI00068ADD64|nr:LysR family transcriptional regulator [Streptomyces sp. NRRL F-5126]